MAAICLGLNVLMYKMHRYNFPNIPILGHNFNYLATSVPAGLPVMDT